MIVGTAGRDAAAETLLSSVLHMETTVGGRIASGGCDEDYELWRKRSPSAGDAAGHGTP